LGIFLGKPKGELKMKRTKGIFSLTLGLTVFFTQFSNPGYGYEEDGEIGNVDFATTCQENVKTTFNNGVSWLYSFEYERSEETFLNVLEEDPNCGMAYWGIAMSIWHQLWAPPDNNSLEKGALVLAKAKELKTMNKREVAYLNAISVYFSGYETKSHNERAQAYANRMDTLQNEFPEDQEAKIFYALSLLASADAKDLSFSNQLKSGAILESIFEDQPNHPGPTHYLIHSYDYPEIAEKALQAARRYAVIAPASAHANHMPSHIFTRLGYWQESIDINLKAVEAGQAFAMNAALEGRWDEEIHAQAYLMYAYLQGGQDEKARGVLDDIQSTTSLGRNNFKVAHPLAAIQARFAMERADWEAAAGLETEPEWYPWSNFPGAEAVTHYARAIGAANLNRPDAVIQEIKALQNLRSALSEKEHSYWKNQIEVQIMASKSLLARIEGKEREALRLMRQAAKIEDEVAKHPVTPGEVVPARELLAFMLLDLGKFEDALMEFQNVLVAAPNRFNGLFGAAKSALNLEKFDLAVGYLGQIIEQTELSSGNRPRLQDAREMWATLEKN